MIDGAYNSLRGYCFQFDSTISAILDNPAAEVNIEQIQDFGYDNYVIQVKHHDTKYTAAQRLSLKKKPIVQLLNNFIEDNSKQYVLYIYFRDVSPSKESLSITELNGILGADSNTFSDANKKAFVKNFTLVNAENFHDSHQKLLGKITTFYAQNNNEGALYYSLISSYLLNIIIENPPTEKDRRKLSKRQLDHFVRNSKQLIFNSAYSDLLGKDKYHKYLKKQYFNTSLNTSPFERFFVIECNASDSISDAKELLLTIKRKWSKNTKRTTEPFAPYIFFRNMPTNILSEFKKELQLESYRIKDGYDFNGANFDLGSITEKPSFANKIYFRIVNEEVHLEEILSKQSRTKEIYQFFFSTPVNFNTNAKHIKIEVDKINDIKNII